MPRLLPGELRWAAGWSAVAVALASLPYVVAWALTPAGYVYTWVLSSPWDVFSYYAKIEQAVRGAWLLTLPYTSEPHAPALLFPQYVLLGKLGALTGLPSPLLYHLARVAGGAVLLLAAYRFLAAVTTELAVRRMAFLLLVFGGGLGWLTGPFGVVGIDITIPESNAYHTLFVNPHFALATAGLLAVATVAVQTAPRFPLGAMARAAACGFAAVVMQPFLPLVVAVVGGLWAGLAGLRGLYPHRLTAGEGTGVGVGMVAGAAEMHPHPNPLPRGEGTGVGVGVVLPTAGAAQQQPGRGVERGAAPLPGGVGGIPPSSSPPPEGGTLPAAGVLAAAARLTTRPGLWLLAVATALPAVLMWLQLQSNPVLAGWTAQNLTPSPSPLHLLVGYGVLAPLAVVGAVRAWRSPAAAGLTATGALLLVAWAVAVPLLFYAPVSVQRRLVEGAQAPLAVLAAGGLWWWAGRLGPRAWGRLRVAALVLAVPGVLWLAVLMVTGAQALRVPFYLPAADAAAIAWVAANLPPGSAVLASPTLGNVLPAYAPVRTYYGHAFETTHAARKLAEADAFFAAAATPEERCRLLTAAGVGYVYEGTLERGALAGTLAGQPGLQPAHQTPGVTIYRVTGCTAAAGGG